MQLDDVLLTSCPRDCSDAPGIAVLPLDLMFAPTGYVGRQPELTQLAGALDDAFSGRARLVMLAGEAGIGKTRPAQQLNISSFYRTTRRCKALVCRFD